MAKMIKCKTCGETISKKAKQCPHCGHDYTQKGMSIVGAIFWSIAILVAIVTLTNNAGKLRDSAPPQYGPSTPNRPHTISKQTPPPPKKQETVAEKLQAIKASISAQDKPIAYSTISLEALNAVLQSMRTSGRALSLLESEAKQNKKDYQVWKQLRNKQLSMQRKRYPKLRDALGPKLRDKLWEHDATAKTVGKGYTRIIFTAPMFAANRNIKEFHERIRVMLSDYRFKRVDYKWVKHAQEWTYFTLQTKPDNKL